jgi:hypothetical protein
MLAALGAEGFGPYYATSDPRTQNSYEFNAFREIILRHASEGRVALKPNTPPARSALRLLHRRIEQQEFGSYEVGGTVPVFFKYPLSALLIPEICETFDTHLVYVIRPLEDIEHTRQRRGWGWQFGGVGAEILYKAMHRAAPLQSHPILEVDFPALLLNRAHHARELAHFAGLMPSVESLQAAVDSVRSENKTGPGIHSNSSRTSV